MIATFIAGTVLLGAIMAGAWGLQRATGNSGWVDVVWSFGLGVAGLILALLPGIGAPSGRQLLVAALVAVWSIRLGLHIAQRSRHGPEDARYAALRREWGPNFQFRLFWFLQIQAAAAAVLGLSILLAAHNPAPWPRGLDLAAIAVMIVAVVGEGIADEQLRRFKADPGNKGRVCDRGLWGWSRHPNYFFEWFGWIAYPLLAIALPGEVSGGWWWGWLALSGPAFMYWLLVHVSGIPPTEQQMLLSRGEVFRAYQARVSRFFPLPPKDVAT
jgi:steroid 5-alpha reductase family enzyme